MIRWVLILSFVLLALACTSRVEYVVVTATPQPTATATATPTSTPTPESTATPTSTPTPEPTATPSATPTPRPPPPPTPTPYVLRTYGERQSDGSVAEITQWSDGRFTSILIQPPVSPTEQSRAELDAYMIRWSQAMRLPLQGTLSLPATSLSAASLPPADYAAALEKYAAGLRAARAALPPPPPEARTLNDASIRYLANLEAVASHSARSFRHLDAGQRSPADFEITLAEHYFAEALTYQTVIEQETRRLGYS